MKSSGSETQPGSDALVGLAAAVADSGARAELLAEVAGLYRRADARIAAVGATCLGGGACCRFDLASHRLYVSTAELAALVQQTPVVWPAGPGRCPYQLGPRCMARDRRPLGCRTYFCNTLSSSMLQAIYEQFHDLFRSLHQRLGAEYHYV
ncbi:MAG: hypothetical protein KAU28_07940, partial [Phycisphaerae bacterium]|nr:hypothetical protein [Phycisphaerae bacterium]